MDVRDAMVARKTIRNFLETPVSNDTIKDLLQKAARAPSGGNLQPWRIYVINEQSMTNFREYCSSRTEPEKPAYDIYPANLKEPYRSSRFKCGEDMYALLNIPREEVKSILIEKNFLLFRRISNHLYITEIGFGGIHLANEFNRQELVEKLPKR